MEDFFEQFKNNLENRKEEPLEEKDWQLLEQRLDQQTGKLPFVFRWWWVALPLLLLLLGSDLFLFLRLARAKQDMSSFEILRDTLIQTRVIYQTDTIYQFRTIYEHPSDYQQSAFRQWISPLFSFNRTYFDSFYSDSAIQNYGEPGLYNSSRIYSDRNKNGEDVSGEHNRLELSQYRARWRNFDALNSSTHGLLSAPYPALTLNYMEPETPEYKKTIGYHIHSVRDRIGTLAVNAYELRPRTFQVGISGGGAYPFNKALNEQGGFSVGLNVSLEFSSTLQMWIDASYFNVHYTSNKMDETLGIPPVEAPSDDFVFTKAEVPQPSYQFSAGMQYLFYTGSRWRPLIGAGYGAVKLLPYEIAYDFEDRSNNIEWKFEKDINQNDLIGNFFLARAGAEYEITDQWNGLVLMMYRTNWKNKGFLAPKMLGIQGGLKYRF